MGNNSIKSTQSTAFIPPGLSDLPIIPELPCITDTVRQNQATVIIGATGSGKTTQVGLHLLQQGLAGDKRIGVTQPRRLAVISLAEFVSGLYGCQAGEEVGYQVRFDDSTMEGTKLKFMTDGILLQEASGDPLFTRYNVLIFDEAHEQGLNTDIGLGLAKRAMIQRPDLRIIIMSATIDTGRFSEYFNNAPVITIQGRIFPIETKFLEPEESYHTARAFHEDGANATLPALAAAKVQQIHTQNQPGHILIFMPGKKEIAQTIDYLNELHLPNLLPLPAHSEMDQAEQARIFEPTAERKVVVATNIAETSITVDNLAYVIDSGLIREMTFDHRHGIGSLRTIEHSKAGLKQRQGRAGRTQPGTYLPLFTEAEWDTGRPEYLEPGQHERPEFSTPEIQREDLSSAVLRMIELGINDVVDFEFMNAPAKGAIKNAIRTLKDLGALDYQQHATDIGAQMAKLPVEPRIARMILEAQRFGCVNEILTIAAALSTGTIFTRPIGEEDTADAAHIRLTDGRGDLFTLLSILPFYEKQKKRDEWATNNYLNQHVLEEILKIREQLQNLLTSMNIPILSLKTQTDTLNHKQRRDLEYQTLGRTITAGLIQNIAAKTPDFTYRRLGKGEMRLHPSSVLRKWDPKIIVCTEILDLNGTTFAVNCQPVELTWIQELAPQLLKVRREPLVHQWTGKTVGHYTVTYLCGVKVDQTYGKAAIQAMDNINVQDRHTITNNRRHRNQNHRRSQGKKHRSRH